MSLENPADTGVCITVEAYYTKMTIFYMIVICCSNTQYQKVTIILMSEYVQKCLW